LASINTHFFVTSAGFAENVFICAIRKKGNRLAHDAAGLRGVLETDAPGVNAFR
jgi:hypothetical protein